jgi:hypothetical protein
MISYARFKFLSVLPLAALTACPAPPAMDAGAEAGPPDVSPVDATPELDAGGDAAVLDVAPMDGAASDGARPDASVTDASVTDGGTACPLARVVVTTSDGTEGAYVTGTVADRRLQYIPPPAGRAIEQDHVVRRAGCRLYDLTRAFGAGSNELIELDPANPYAPRRTITLPPIPMVGTPNPYDVVEVSPTKAYLALYNSPRLWVFNPATGAMTGSVDLTPFTDRDGIPEAVLLHVAGGRAWVALQQLDRMGGFAPPSRSTVVAIDTATDQPADLDPAMPGLQASTQLTYGNPQTATPLANGRFWAIASTGTFGRGDDGGIDVLDTSTGRVAQTFAASVLGGDPGGLAAMNDERIWYAVRLSGDGGSRTEVREINVTRGMVRADPVFTRAEPLGDLQRGPDGNLWAINGSFGASGAVYVHGPDGASLSTFALPPRGDAGATGTYSLAFAP